MRSSILVSAVAMMLLALGGKANAEVISIPNSSFESPMVRAAPYATSSVSDWSKAPAPDWWALQGYSAQQWQETVGVFYNVPGPTNIDNVDGEQAAFLFSTPGVELYQQLAATYEVGKAYQLTIAFQGGGQGMKLDIPIEMRLYYLDDLGSRITIDATEILNTTDESVSSLKHLDDGILNLPTVAASDDWAGRNIGIEIISTVSFMDAGGFWRIDNVRLSSVPEPATLIVASFGLGGLLRRRKTA